jgi:indolepyruvate ferredoxin oxidoreductase alpha subunit
MDQSVQTIQQAMNLPGVKVILARQECAIQVKRYREPDARILVVDENCNLCKLCIMQTGCAAISLGETAVLIDDSLCTACGLCLQVCNRDALIKEKI